MEQLGELQLKIGYSFNNSKLIMQAMTHSSYYNEHRHELPGDNERLEFLGDAVLEMVSSEYLYGIHTDMNEGELTTLRASKVCEPTLALCARLFDMQKYIMLGHGEEKNGGRSRDSIVSDALEALIGAIFLDGGFISAKDFILQFVMIDLSKNELFCDSKTTLQELVQEKLNASPVYELIKEEGPEHNRIFYETVSIEGIEYGTGHGRSKKAAQQMAADQAICAFKRKFGV